MQLILYLIQKYKNGLLFFLLELIAFIFTIQLHSYSRSKIVNSANEITGGLYKQIFNINDYIGLKKENEALALENARLHNIINSNRFTKVFFKDSLTYNQEQKFSYTTAQVLYNDFDNQNNFLTLDKGVAHGIGKDYAVVNNLGVVGVTANITKHYSSVISILNKSFTINAKFKKNEYFGTLNWNGKKVNIVQLLDIPRQAQVKLGDTIVTGGKSSIFPEGIPIGKVTDVIYNDGRFEQIDIKLFNDMRNVKNVYIIKNLHRQEINKLLDSIHE